MSDAITTGAGASNIGNRPDFNPVQPNRESDRQTVGGRAAEVGDTPPPASAQQTGGARMTQNFVNNREQPNLDNMRPGDPLAEGRPAGAETGASTRYKNGLSKEQVKANLKLLDKMTTGDEKLPDNVLNKMAQSPTLMKHLGALTEAGFTLTFVPAGTEMPRSAVPLSELSGGGTINFSLDQMESDPDKFVASFSKAILGVAEGIRNREADAQSQTDNARPNPRDDLEQIMNELAGTTAPHPVDDLELDAAAGTFVLQPPASGAVDLELPLESAGEPGGPADDDASSVSSTDTDSILV